MGVECKNNDVKAYACPTSSDHCRYLDQNKHRTINYSEWVIRIQYMYLSPFSILVSLEDDSPARDKLWLSSEPEKSKNYKHH